MIAEHYDHTYPLENSDESTRLQNQHEVIKNAMGSLVLAPVDFSTSPLQILDSGTADGTWIRDLASSTGPTGHEFVGVDINPAEFPADPPPRTTYRAQDINQPWPGDWLGRFDLVHQRLVLVAGGAKQKEALESIGALVKPGGWIQLIEGTNKLPEGCGPELHTLIGVMNSVFQNMGSDLDLAQRLPGWLKDMDFVDVQYEDIDMKLGATNPKADLAHRGVISTGIAAKSLAQFGKNLPPGKLSLTPEKLDTMSSDLEEELKAMGGFYPLRAVWARRAT